LENQEKIQILTGNTGGNLELTNSGTSGEETWPGIEIPVNFRSFLSS